MDTAIEEAAYPQEIPTDSSDLVLRVLGSSDANAYFTLKQANLDHLAQNGDFVKLRDATEEQLSEDLTHNKDAYGIFHDGELIGNVTLTHREAGTFVLGYWLDSSSGGHGFATRACQTAVDYARDHLGANTMYAGVTKGNTASERLLTRLGFVPIQDMGAYTRFRLAFGQGEQ